MSRKRRREQAKPKTLRMPLLPREARASVPGQGGDVKSAWQQPTRLGGQRRKASSQIQGQAKGQVQAPSPQARKTLRTRRPWKDQKHQHQECQRLARGHLLVQREQQHRTLHHPHLLKHHPRPRCHLSPPLPHQQLPAAPASSEPSTSSAPPAPAATATKSAADPSPPVQQKPAPSRETTIPQVDIINQAMLLTEPNQRAAAAKARAAAKAPSTEPLAMSALVSKQSNQPRRCSKSERCQ